MATFQVTGGTYDGYEVISSSTVNTSSTTIPLNSSNVAGFWFRSTGIARHTAIAKAVLKFPTVTSATGSGTLANLTLRGGADMYGSSSPYNGAAGGFVGFQYNAETYAAVDGSKIAATTAQFQTTGIDVTAIVQEILDMERNPGGSTYNTSDFIFQFHGDGSGSGNQVTVGTYDGAPGSGATLDITYATDATGVPTSISQDATGSNPAILWTNTTGPFTATFPGDGAGGWSSNYVTIKGFGLSLPTGANINGIDIKFDANGSQSFVSNVQLVDASGNKSYDHSWQYNSLFVANGTTYYGGSTDKWGRDWTAADLNSANFGLLVKVRNTSGGGGTLTISNVQITVHYNNDNLGYYTIAQTYRGIQEEIANSSYLNSGNQGIANNTAIIKINNTLGRTINVSRVAFPLRAIYASVTSGGGKDGGFTTIYDRSANPATFRVYNNFTGTLPLSSLTPVQTLNRKLKDPNFREYNLILDSPLAIASGGSITVAVTATGVSGVSEPQFVSYLGGSTTTEQSVTIIGGDGSPSATTTVTPSGVIYELYETVPPGGANIVGDSNMTVAGYDVQFGSATAIGDSSVTATGAAMSYGSALAAGDSKMYADRITAVGNSNMTVDGTINPLAVTKTYQYKIYDENWNFLGIWDDVVSTFGYSQEINSAGSAISVTLARNSDTGTASYDVLADDSGTAITTDDGLTIAAETETLNAIGPGTNVDLNLNVKVYEFSSDTLTVAGDLVFTGYISMYTSQYGNTENTVVSIFSYGADLDNYLLTDSTHTNTRVPYLSDDPGDILMDALGRFNADGGIVTYQHGVPLTTNSIDRPTDIEGSPWIVTYEFNVNTMLEVVKKCLELAPTDWFFYTDLATNLLHFHPRPTTPDHYFYLGKHVLGLSLEKTMEGIINDVVFTGGKPANIVLDRFNDVAGTALTSHTGEVGATWIKQAGSAAGVGFTITNANRIRANASGHQLYYANTPASTSNYTIKVDYYVPSGGITGGDIGVVGRVDPSSGNCYMARIVPTGGVELYKYISGTFTLLGSGALPSVPAVGSTKKFEFKLDGAQLTVTVDGTSYVDLEDHTIVSGSYVGLRSGASSTDTVGQHIDNFQVQPVDQDTSPAIFKRYQDTTSIANYRRGLNRVSDNRVSVETSADTIVASLINRANTPRYRSNITISGSTYPIKTIQLGDLVGFRNFGNYVDDLQLQVVRIDYSPDSVQLQLDTLLPSVPKRLEDINRNLNQAQVEDNPDAPDS